MSDPRPDVFWTHLYWLTVLEEQKSYTRAAEKLAVSKSASQPENQRAGAGNRQDAGPPHHSQRDAQ
ncbi:Uncharacterised protein [Raoultella terrigena]|uniref:LysR family transcriptional regulator n=1 Tax=Raoultella terrigena TaxID=577 RepID=A0A4U9CZC8_RAOTE|nr:Uncharacterised protein [Raoultella terrigena]